MEKGRLLIASGKGEKYLSSEEEGGGGGENASLPRKWNFGREVGKNL